MAVQTVARPLRGPYETCIMAFMIVGATTIFLPNGGTPRSIDSILIPPLLLVWSIMLLAGSALTLLGIVWRGRYITALGVERIGLILHTAACLIYVIALVASWNKYGNTLVSTAFIASIATANIWRAFQITASIRRILFIASQIAGEEGE